MGKRNALWLWVIAVLTLPLALAMTVGIGIGKPAPTFTAKDLAGKKVDLKALKGKVVLLHFWATR